MVSATRTLVIPTVALALLLLLLVPSTSAWLGIFDSTPQPSEKWLALVEAYKPSNLSLSDKIIGLDIPQMGFGVQAVKDIEAGEVLMEVPVETFVDEDRVLRRHPQWLYLFSGKIATTTIEGVFFARVRAGIDTFENDKYKVMSAADYFYIQNLQDCYDGLQMDRDVLIHLPPWSRKIIRTHQKLATKDFEFMKSLPEANYKVIDGVEYVFGVNESLYRDGLCSKWSRAFTAERNKAQLVPFADLINHSGGGWNCVYKYDEEKRAMVVTATKPIKAGGQLYDNYGENFAHTSTHFLTYYGFTSPLALNLYFQGIVLGEVPMRFPYVSAHDPNYKIKMDLLSRHYVKHNDQGSYWYPNGPMNSFWLGHKHFREYDVSMARVLLLNATEFSSYKISQLLNIGLTGLPNMLSNDGDFDKKSLAREDVKLIDFFCETCMLAKKEIGDGHAEASMRIGGDLEGYLSRFSPKKRFLIEMAEVLYKYHSSLIDRCLQTYACIAL